MRKAASEIAEAVLQKIGYIYAGPPEPELVDDAWRDWRMGKSVPGSTPVRGRGTVKARGLLRGAPSIEATKTMEHMLRFFGKR